MAFSRPMEKNPDLGFVVCDFSTQSQKKQKGFDSTDAARIRRNFKLDELDKTNAIVNVVIPEDVFVNSHCFSDVFGRSFLTRGLKPFYDSVIFTDKPLSSLDDVNNIPEDKRLKDNYMLGDLRDIFSPLKLSNCRY